MSAPDTPSSSQLSTKRTSFPTFFLTHGVAYLMDLPPSHRFFGISAKSSSAQWLRDFTTHFNLKGENAPKGIVIVSAHWETSNQVLRVTAQKQHTKLYYDYGGFPPEMYSIQFNPPGDLALSEKIISLLKNEGIKAEADPNRNFDHGAFIPLKVIWPEAEIPVVELSIDESWDPAFHLKVGNALKSLKNEGYLLICSGSSTHNMNPDGKANAEFIKELTRLVESPSLTPEQRIRKTVLEWTKLPYARAAHPAEDHFVPFFVAVGAAEGIPGKLIGKVEDVRDWHMSSFLFE